MLMHCIVHKAPVEILEATKVSIDHVDAKGT